MAEIIIIDKDPNRTFEKFEICQKIYTIFRDRFQGILNTTNKLLIDDFIKEQISENLLKHSSIIEFLKYVN